MMAPMNAPPIEPIVPNTMTAKAGSRSCSPISGFVLITIANSAPPSPDKPAEMKDEIVWVRSMLMPEDAASDGLSATARILRPSVVYFSTSMISSTLPKTPITSATLQ